METIIRIADNTIERHCFSLWIQQKEGREYFNGKVIFEKTDENSYLDPAFVISRKEIRATGNPLQQLMNDLWQIGIRPSQEIDNSGQLKATENHLHDMQEINKKLLSKILK